MFEHHIYCLEGEEWRDISGYEGIYQASSIGRIRTVDGKTTDSDKHGIRIWKGRILKSRGKNPTTGNRVTLWKFKKSKDVLVGRLVCAAFHGQPTDQNMTVNHKDGNRFNNNIDNLEWLTLADNIRHGFETGLYHTAKSLRLTVNGEEKCFNSLSSASKHIGRNHGYISRCIQFNKKVYTKIGEEVLLIV